MAANQTVRLAFVRYDDDPHASKKIWRAVEGDDDSIRVQHQHAWNQSALLGTPEKDKIRRLGMQPVMKHKHHFTRCNNRFVVYSLGVYKQIIYAEVYEEYNRSPVVEDHRLGLQRVCRVYFVSCCLSPLTIGKATQSYSYLLSLRWSKANWYSKDSATTMENALVMQGDPKHCVVRLFDCTSTVGPEQRR